MSHSQVYKYFKEILPDMEKKVIKYFPNGKNSIRVRQDDRQDFIFSFESPLIWRYETANRFITNMKGRKEERKKGSMNEAIRYIFNSLNNSEKSIAIINKALNKQKSFNHTIIFLAIIMVAKLTVQNTEIAGLRNDIADLKSKIKELKNTEGD